MRFLEVVHLCSSHEWTLSKKSPYAVECFCAPPPNYGYRFRSYSTSRVSDGGMPHPTLHERSNHNLQGWTSGSRGFLMSVCVTLSPSCIKTPGFSSKITRTLRANLFCWERTCATLSSVRFLRRTVFMNPSHFRQQMTHHIRRMRLWITQCRSELRTEAYSETTSGSRAGHGGIRASTQYVSRETPNCMV